LPSLYPGNPYGKHTDQLAYQIAKVKKDYDPDVLVRYHGCKQIYGWDRVLYQKSAAGSELDNLARAAVTVKDTFCMLCFDRPAKSERTLEVSVETNGGDNGVGNGFNQVNMREAILNIMSHLKMIPRKEIKVAPIQYVSYKRVPAEGGNISSSGINSTRGGFFKPLVDIKQSVKTGQTVGEIRNFFGEVVETIKSPIDGVVIGYFCEAPHVGSGQWRIFELAEPTELR
jgi:predicted deacylase